MNRYEVFFRTIGGHRRFECVPGEHIPLLEKEGRTRHQNKRIRSEAARRGGQVGGTLRPEQFRLTDHPVCGSSVASQLYLLMPQPPLLCKEGNMLAFNLSVTSHYL